jgi:hypothetical protein
MLYTKQSTKNFSNYHKFINKKGSSIITNLRTKGLNKGPLNFSKINYKINDLVRALNQESENTFRITHEVMQAL